MKPSNNRIKTLSIIAGIGATILGISTLAALAANPPKVGDSAPDFTLKALDGKNVTLSSLTKKGNVALVVLRGYPGYQCPICTMQVGELIGKRDQFSAANTPVVMVYPGPSAELTKRANEFAIGKNLPKNFTLVMDPDFAIVNKYGLRWNAPNETAYPSTFVINKAGKIVFAKISKEHGGRATSTEILAAIPR